MSVLDVPGMITQREEVTVSSDEEDEHFGTFALLKKGDEKKKALREVERQKNLKAMDVGDKPSLAQKASEEASSSAAAAAAEKAPSPRTTEPKPPQAGSKRPRRGGGAKAKTSVAVDLVDGDDDDDLEERDKKILDSSAAARDKMKRQMSAQLKALENDDDDDDPPALPAARARAAPSKSSFGPTAVWLKVKQGRGGEGEGELMRVEGALEAKLVPRIAQQFGLLPERVALWDEAGRQLDVRHTAQQLGLAEKAMIFVEELEAPKGLGLKLSRQGEREPTKLVHPPGAPFADLLKAYCSKTNLSPSAYRLEFDGDHLQPHEKPEDYEMEEDDMSAPRRAAPPRPPAP
jgi:hypothetical protein